MYRYILVLILLVATACKGGTSTASAASSNNAASGAALGTPNQGTQTAAPANQASNTAGDLAGPTSTTNGGSTSSVGVMANGPERRIVSIHDSPQGTPNPNRVPNEMGRIMVLEYHLITDHNGDYARERGQFRKDLELLYNRGYRPVNMSDVLDKKLNLPRGLSPVVFVFDDASPEQFRYINNNGKLEIDPTSGMGIWLDFKKTHADWNNKAVFCLLSGASAGHNFFGDRGVQGQKSNWRFPKVRWLADNGFELCDHTLWHAQLNKYPDAFVQEQIARNAIAIDSAVPGYKIRSMALPQGLWPKNRALASKGSWTNPKTGKTVSYNWPVVFEVAGGSMRSPYDPAFNPGMTPRIQVIGNAIESMINKLEQSGNAYVSDGNPAVIAKPAASPTATASGVKR
jgi:Polysaccharide deacetylase